MHGTTTGSLMVTTILSALNSLQQGSTSKLVGFSLRALLEEIVGEDFSYEAFSDGVRQLATNGQLTILARCVNLRETQKGGVTRSDEPHSETVRVDIASIPEAWLFVSHFALNRTLNYIPQGTDGSAAFIVRDFRICLAEYCPSSISGMKTLCEALDT